MMWICADLSCLLIGNWYAHIFCLVDSEILVKLFVKPINVLEYRSICFQKLEYLPEYLEENKWLNFLIDALLDGAFVPFDTKSASSNVLNLFPCG